MALSHRIERIAEQLREEVSQILATEVSDPGVGLVTISRVKVTPDLSLARFYWTILGDAAERKKTEKALQRAAPFVRHVLSGRVTLRRVPEVHFQFDEGLAAHTRVEEILHELQQEEAARVEAAEVAPDGTTAPAADESGPAAAPPPADDPTRDA
jgi:ribosome-binding factor A